MKLLDRPFVACRWADAHGNATAEYAEHELPHSPVYYTFYGFLLRQDDIGITLATEVSDENTYRGTTFIPAAMVVEIVPIRLVRRRSKPQEAPDAEA